MKRWIVLSAVLLAAGGAIYVSERRKVEAPVSPSAVLTLAADVQRGASRVPAAATRISDAEEIQIGDGMAARATMMTLGGTQDPDAAVVEAYLQKIGSQVAARAQRKLPYRFHYISQDGMVNAFALPGGHVFIGKGLLELMDSEDQLAAVLGHEVEHIDRRHCVERVQLEARMRKLRLGVVGELAQIPVEVFQAGYTKNQELEADSEGAKLAVRAGYSYQGAVRLFEDMEKRYGRQQSAPEQKSLPREIGKLAAQTVSGYFQSHPPAADRVRQIRELAAREGWQPRSERPMPAAIAQRVKASAPSSCAVTVPNGSQNSGDTPSCSGRVSPNGFRGNHGNGKLWVGLPTDGKLLITPEKDGSLSEKFPWWRAVCGRLIITGRRLDAPAVPLRTSIPEGYGEAGFQASGIIFPSEGCWEITGKAGDAALTFVVEVRRRH